MKASGVYAYVIDESLTTSGSVALSIIVPIMTTKGNRVEVVTPANWKDKIGYDLSYNPRYYGLALLMQSYARATIYRMNVNAFCANAVLPRVYNDPSYATLDVDFANNEPAGTHSVISSILTNSTLVGQSAQITISATNTQNPPTPTQLHVSLTPTGQAATSAILAFQINNPTTADINLDPCVLQYTQAGKAFIINIESSHTIAAGSVWYANIGSPDATRVTADVPGSIGVVPSAGTDLTAQFTVTGGAALPTGATITIAPATSGLSSNGIDATYYQITQGPRSFTAVANGKVYSFSVPNSFTLTVGDEPVSFVATATSNGPDTVVAGTQVQSSISGWNAGVLVTVTDTAVMGSTGVSTIPVGTYEWTDGIKIYRWNVTTAQSLSYQLPVPYVISATTTGHDTALTPTITGAPIVFSPVPSSDVTTVITSYADGNDGEVVIPANTTYEYQGPLLKYSATTPSTDQTLAAGQTMSMTFTSITVGAEASNLSGSMAASAFSPTFPTAVQAVIGTFTNGTNALSTIFPAGEYYYNSGSKEYLFKVSSSVTIPNGGFISMTGIATEVGSDSNLPAVGVALNPSFFSPSIPVSITGTTREAINGFVGDSVRSFTSIDSVDEFIGKIFQATDCLGVVINSPGSWADFGVTLTRSPTVKSFVTAASISLGEPVSPGIPVKILSSVGSEIGISDGASVIEASDGTGQIGTIDLSHGIISFSVTPANAAIQVSYVPSDPAKIVWHVALIGIDEVDGNFVIEEGDISFDPTSSIYAETTGLFTNFSLKVVNVPNQEYGVTTPVKLLNSSNGEEPTADQLDLNALIGKEGFMVLMNGVVDKAVLGAFVNFTTKWDKFLIADIPNFHTYDDTYAWTIGLPASSDYATFAGSDLVDTSIGKISVYPSIKVGLAYSGMYSATGKIFDPVAGPLYGSVGLTELFENDFLEYGDELKTNKINYLKPNGVLWEQRTRYGLESDLSYIHANIILKFFVQRLYDFGAQFNFLLIGPTQLNLMSAGLESICNEYVNGGYMWAAVPHVPTWSEVEENGIRETDIHINVKIAEDSEVLTFYVHVKRTASEVS